MVVSAKHFESLTNGYEQRSDGLFVHRGRTLLGGVDSTAPGANVANWQLAVRGQTDTATTFGLVAQNRSQTKNTFYVRDDGLVWADNLQVSTTLALPAGSIPTSAIAPNAVHGLWFIQAAPVGSTTSSTPVAMPGGFGTGLSIAGYTGGPLLVQGLFQLNYSTANGQPNISLYVDAADQNVRGSAAAAPAVGSAFSVPFLAYFAAFAVGTHTLAFYWNTNGGTLNSNSGIYSWVVVQEMRR